MFNHRHKLVHVTLHLSNGSKLKAVCSEEQWEDNYMTWANHDKDSVDFDNCTIHHASDILAVEYK